MVPETGAIRKGRCVKAAQELSYLLERGYPKASALRFVGDHHQLSQVERDLLFRGVFRRDAAERRRKARLRPSRVKGASLVIDGHNITITLENAMRGRPFLVGADGFVRDVSRVFRSFRPTARTRDAWRHVIRFLKDYPPGKVHVVLDAPLSHSGKLRAQLQRWLEAAGLEGTVVLSETPESAMLAMGGVLASADSVALDRAERVFDLAGHIILRRWRLQPIINFST